MSKKITKVKKIKEFLDKKELEKLLENPYKYGNELSIKKLVILLKKLAFVYYNEEKPMVPDRVFDMLRDILEERDSENKYLKEIGSKKESDVELPFPLPSLNKNKNDSAQLDRWFKKYHGPYVISDKLDGMSALVYKYKNKSGKIITELYTRGDGEKGSDISKRINNIFGTVDIPLNTAIRGEIIISKKDFKNIDKQYANVRNTVTTIRSRSNPDPEVLKISKFVAYSIIYPRLDQKTQMEKLKKTGLEVVYHEIKNKIDKEYLSNLLIKRKKEGEYDIDGIVVIDASKVYDLQNKNPDHGFAFKKLLSDQVVETDVIDVIWDISKHGYLKPTVQLVPVKVGGVTISNVTGHNAKFIVENNIGPGALLKIVRSGDVIPKIIEVLKPSANGKPKYPNVPYKWNNTNVDLILKDIHGDQKDNVIIKQLVHFFKTLDIKYLDEGILKLLVESGMKDVFAIMDSKEVDFTIISGLGSKLYQKVQREIKEKIENCKLENLMASSMFFGRGIGTRKLKIVLENYPDIFKDKENNIKNKLNKIKGFEEKTSSVIAKGIEPFNKFRKKISERYNISHLDTIKKMGKKDMDNLKVVFTGFRDKELEDKIMDRGGKVSTTVSGNTTHLLYKTEENDSSKFKKAKVLGVKLMQVDKFKKLYKL